LGIIIVEIFLEEKIIVSDFLNGINLYFEDDIAT